MKQGKLPARPGAVTTQLRDYLPPTPALPMLPATYGHWRLVSTYPMYANADVGCCVFSGAGHEHEIFGAEGGNTVAFTDANILAAYSAVTHYDPNAPLDANGNNPTDQGTDVAQALEWRRTVGMTDAAGRTRRLAAYAALKPRSMPELGMSTYLFSASGVGVEFPNYAMDRFNAGQPWSAARQGEDTTIGGGHYFPVVGRWAGYWVAITWGRPQLVDDAFLCEYMDEGYALFDTDFFVLGKSPEKFNAAQLITDMEEVPAL